MYPLALQALVAEYVREILAKADEAQRARRAGRWRDRGLLDRAEGAGFDAPARALIRGGRSVPDLACGICWLMDVVAGQHGQAQTEGGQYP